MIVKKINKFLAENFTGDNFLYVVFDLLKVADIKPKIRGKITKDIIQSFFPNYELSINEIPEESFKEESLKE